MELESLFGLPAHPLVVHGAVVLLPLAALVTIITALVPRARRAYAPVALGLALCATVAVGLAQGSGEALEENVDETELVEEHTEKGETVLPWAIAVTIAAAGVVGVQLMGDRRPELSSRSATAALVVVALLTGAGATWAIVEVGHSGAAATWEDEDEGGENENEDEDGEGRDDEDHEGSEGAADRD